MTAERAAFDDYKRRLNGDPDLWQTRDEWWHVTSTRPPLPLKERAQRSRPQIADLAGGSVVVSSWSLPE